MVAIQQHEQPINYKALGWTIAVHAILLLCLYFMVFTLAAPPPVPQVEGGLEVNLGTGDEGSGHSQPMSTKAPAEYHATVVYSKPAPAAKSPLPKAIVQTTQADAPEINNKSTSKKATPAPVVPQPKPKPHVVEKPKYSYPGDNGGGGNNAAQNKPGGSEGKTNGPGDQGRPGGTPGANNYSGTPGNGTGGIGHTLVSRDMYPRSFIAEFSESGTVVIHVTIDKKGNIVAKNVVRSSSPELTKLALEKLRNVHYSPSDDANPQDFDDITIRFQTRQ